jgi:hypothetical protein
MKAPASSAELTFVALEADPNFRRALMSDMYVSALFAQPATDTGVHGCAGSSAADA